MPQYLFLICIEEGVRVPDGAAEAMAWASELDGRGARLAGNALQPVDEAQCVRVRDGEVLTTDGPFAETKEVIGGFDLIECDSMAEAVEIASKHPVAKVGTIEIRELYRG